MSAVIITALIVAGVLTFETGHTINASQNQNIAKGAYYNFNNALREQGLDPNTFDFDAALRRLYYRNIISEDEYKDYVKLAKGIEDKYKDGETFWEGIGSYWFTSTKDIKKAAELYKVMADNIPAIKYATNAAISGTPEELRNAFLNSSNPIAQVVAPDYEDVNFEGLQREVKPVKLWTGQELADLHNIDYNPDTYYNLIKASTEAQVDLANYEAAQMNNASMVDDTNKVTSYLDAIRNNKAEAIATGATLGARAANELLSNVNSINDYATNQNTVAQNQFNTVDNVLRADAQAKLSARNYFDQLAQTLSGHSMQLYQNDTDRFGQDWLSNAEFYTADQNLRGQREYANASMYANMAQANAAINAANAARAAQGNEYAWVFDRFLGANNNDVQKAFVQMDEYLTKLYSGGLSTLELMELNKDR